MLAPSTYEFQPVLSSWNRSQSADGKRVTIVPTVLPHVPFGFGLRFDSVLDRAGNPARPYLWTGTFPLFSTYTMSGFNLDFARVITVDQIFDPSGISHLIFAMEREGTLALCISEIQCARLPAGTVSVRAGSLDGTPVVAVALDREVRVYQVVRSSFFTASLKQLGQSISYAGGTVHPSISLASLTDGLLVAWAETEQMGGQRLRLSRWDGATWKFIDSPGCAESSCFGITESHPDIIVIGGVPHVSWRSKIEAVGKVYVARLTIDPTWSILPTLTFNGSAGKATTGISSLAAGAAGDLFIAFQDVVDGIPVVRIYRWSGEHWIWLKSILDAESVRTLTSGRRLLIAHQSGSLLRVLDIETNNELFRTQLDRQFWTAASSVLGDVSVIYANEVEDVFGSREEIVVQRMNR
jgi:hypothetical protein